MAGNVAEDRFLFANESLVHGSVAGFVDYATTRSFIDLNCGLAGETTFTSNLGTFQWTSHHVFRGARLRNSDAGHCCTNDFGRA